jgi:hypothetical protein
MTQQKQRQPGQYWVKFLEFSNTWIVASWKDNAWELPTIPSTYGDHMMLEIDETPVTREPKTEPKKSILANLEYTWPDGSMIQTAMEMIQLNMGWIIRDLSVQVERIALAQEPQREATLQLSYQVERIANALESKNEPLKLKKKLSYQEVLDVAKKLSEDNQEEQQEGVTGPALELAKKLVESWNKPHSNPPVIDLPKLWKECGEDKWKFGDHICTLMNQGSVFGHIKPKEGGYRPAGPGVTLEPSAYDKNHPDYKGDLGAVQKQNPTTWIQWQFLIETPYSKLSHEYPFYQVAAGSTVVKYKVWLPKGVSVGRWYHAYNVKFISEASQPIFGPDFPRPDWWEG